MGAASAIAEATARLFAMEGSRLCLAGRNVARLEAIAADLRVRGASQVDTIMLDANNLEEHGGVIAKAAGTMGGLDTVLIAHGTLPDQQECQASVEATFEALKTNALSSIALLTLIANRFEKQGFGTIVVISSVAGDRGRQSNYVYGSAKAAITVFTQGLRNRLSHAGIKVVTVKPGWVDTPMTAAFRKGFFWATPRQVAKRIHRAVADGKDVVYAPWYWRWIMAAINAVPEPIFKRLRL